MSGKNNIEEIFREGLQNYEAPVDPGIWNSIESNIPSSGGGAGGASGATGGISLGKIATIATIAATSVGIGIGVYSVMSDDDNDKKSARNKEVVEVNEDQPSDIEEIQDQETYKEPAEIKEGHDISDDQEEMVDQKEGNGAQTKDDIDIYSNDDGPSDYQNSEKKSPQNNQGENNGFEEQPDKESPNNKKEDHATNDYSDPETPPTAPAKTAPLELKISASDYETEVGNEVTLSANTNGEKVKWTISLPNGESVIKQGNNVQITLNVAGNYLVKATSINSNGESVSKETVIAAHAPVLIKVRPELLDNDGRVILFPNAASNNKLEYEFLVDKSQIGRYSISVMNRSGKLVYSSNDPEAGWDGRDNTGQLVSPDNVYFMFVTVIDSQGNAQKPIKKTVVVKH